MSILHSDAPKCCIDDVLNGKKGCICWNYGHCTHPDRNGVRHCPEGIRSEVKKLPYQSIEIIEEPKEPYENE